MQAIPVPYAILRNIVPMPMTSAAFFAKRRKERQWSPRAEGTPV